jgi:hypothetical protein
MWRSNFFAQRTDLPLSHLEVVVKYIHQSLHGLSQHDGAAIRGGVIIFAPIPDAIPVVPSSLKYPVAQASDAAAVRVKPAPPQQ